MKSLVDNVDDVDLFLTSEGILRAKIGWKKTISSPTAQYKLSSSDVGAGEAPHGERNSNNDDEVFLALVSRPVGEDKR